MEFPIKFDIVKTGCNFQKIVIFLSLKIDFVLTNSVDLDEMWHFIWVFTGCMITPFWEFLSSKGL